MKKEVKHIPCSVTLSWLENAYSRPLFFGRRFWPVK